MVLCVFPLGYDSIFKNLFDIWFLKLAGLWSYSTLRDLSPGENVECPFLMRSPWRSKAESPKHQWNWKLEVLFVICPNLQSHFSTCIYQLLFALLCPSPFHPRSPSCTAFRSLQNALQTFSSDTYHRTMKLAKKVAPAQLWRWGSRSTDSSRGLLKVTQSSRSWTKVFFLGCAGSYLRHVGPSIFPVPCRIFSCSIGTLSCGMWDLIPWPGIEPRCSALRV